MHRVRLLLIGLVATCIFAVIHRPLRSTGLMVLRAPFALVKNAVNIVAVLPRLPSLGREIAFLRAELIQRQLEISTLREAVRHLSYADKLLSSQAEPRGVVARVVGRSQIPVEHTVLLDKGVEDRVEVDGVVVDADGVVGRVAEAHAHTSLVVLLTDADSRVAAMVERTRETGLLVGRLQGYCDLVYLDVHADVQPGDRIVTAGLGGPFPKGLTLGTVSEVARDEIRGAASAKVRPGVQMGRLEEVLCLPSAKIEEAQ